MFLQNKQTVYFDSHTEDSDTCHKKASTYWKMSIDGASKKNPGPSGAGVAVEKNGVLFATKQFYLGIKTNNQAEYLALVLGLLTIKEFVHPCDMVLIISDSQLLVNQVNGTYKVKNPLLKKLHTYAARLLTSLHYDIMHVLRYKNVHADKLANKAVKEKTAVPPLLFTLLEKEEITLF